MSKFPVVNYSDIIGNICVCSLSESLRQKGYVILRVNSVQDKIHFRAEEFLALSNWQSVLGNAFCTLTESEKQLMGKFRSEKGVAVGYRKDGDREFIETHLKEGYEANGTCEILELVPTFRKIPEDIVAADMYNNCMINLTILLRKIGYAVLFQIAKSFPQLRNSGSENNDIGYSYFSRLTDTTYNGKREMTMSTEDTSPIEAAQEDITYSSSVLRLCNYPNQYYHPSEVPDSVFSGKDSNPRSFGFGAHTDTSFITLGCCNTNNPGLEIRALDTKEWIAVEKEVSTLAKASEGEDYYITICVGEFLQVLSNHHYMAVVHRVTVPMKEVGQELSTQCDVNNGSRNNDNRVSCPLIIRGKNKAIIPAVPDINIPEGSTDMPILSTSYNGMNMKLIHLLLDKMRAKCMNSKHENDDWILSAFPDKHL